MFNNAEYPESWGLGYIVPIFKGGDPNSAKNYRGITLNNILAKIYSQIIFNRLTKWTEKNETTVHSRYLEVGGNKKKYRDNESSRYPIRRFQRKNKTKIYPVFNI